MPPYPEDYPDILPTGRLWNFDFYLEQYSLNVARITREFSADAPLVGPERSLFDELWFDLVLVLSELDFYLSGF